MKGQCATKPRAQILKLVHNFNKTQHPGFIMIFPSQLYKS